MPDFFLVNFSKLTSKPKKNCDMDLLYFLKAIYRKLWIILGLSVVSVIAAFLFLVNKKPYFVSIAQYSTGFTAEKVRLIDGTTAIDLYSADVKFDNVIETMKSPEVISMISYKLLLHDLSGTQKPYKRLTDKQKQSTVYKLVNIDTARKILSDKLFNHDFLRTDSKKERLLLDYLILYNYHYDGLLKELYINRVQRTDYLDIIFRSDNADLSAWVVNAIGFEFLNYYKNLNSKRTNENALNIKDMVEKQQAKVDSLNLKLLNEKINQGAVDPLVRTAGAMETVTELETKLADEKSKYNEHFNRISYLNKNLKDAQAKLNAGSSNDEVLRLTNKKNDLVAALARKGGSDPELEKQINDLRNEINTKTSSGSNRTKILESIDDINKQINEEEALMNASNSTMLDYSSRIRKYAGLSDVDPGSGLKMEVIRTELENENKQLNVFKEKYIQAQGLSKDDPTSNFIQTRMGQPAPEAESKKTLVKMALAGISVFFLTSILFIFLEIFDSSVKTPTIFNRLARLKVTTVLNEINTNKMTFSDIILHDISGNKYPKQLVFKNSIKKLRYEVLNSGKKVFLISSTQRSAGKSSIIESLASSLVVSNRRVLIIDLNFRNNSLTKNYNTQHFIQDISLDPESDNYYCKLKASLATTTENLDIIGCRSGDFTPVEALNHIKMNDFVRMLKAEYDFILIEGASLNYFSDSKELAQFSEGMFIVFAADAVISQSDLESMKFLSELKEKNYGVILNKVLTQNINS
jgi:Mrp family chromosome partitioning ATPase/uncharacterized protein involved in exopolysaccharide biosynthesis